MSTQAATTLRAALECLRFECGSCGWVTELDFSANPLVVTSITGPEVLCRNPSCKNKFQVRVRVNAPTKGVL